MLFRILLQFGSCNDKNRVRDFPKKVTVDGEVESLCPGEHPKWGRGEVRKREGSLAWMLQETLVPLAEMGNAREPVHNGQRLFGIRII